MVLHAGTEFLLVISFLTFYGHKEEGNHFTTFNQYLIIYENGNFLYSGFSCSLCNTRHRTSVKCPERSVYMIHSTSVRLCFNCVTVPCMAHSFWSLGVNLLKVSPAQSLIKYTEAI